jgi:hypothetical protein
VFVHTRYLNGAILYPYVGLPDAMAMDAGNYDPRLGTPLYDQTVVLLGTVIAKSTELAAAGVPVRTVTLLITDGGDYGSKRATAKEVRALVADMVAQENHVVAAMGISDGTTDFKKVFRDMGIADRWILTPGNTVLGEIRYSTPRSRCSRSRPPAGMISRCPARMGSALGPLASYDLRRLGAVDPQSTVAARPARPHRHRSPPAPGAAPPPAGRSRPRRPASPPPPARSAQPPCVER